MTGAHFAFQICTWSRNKSLLLDWRQIYVQDKDLGDLCACFGISPWGLRQRSLPEEGLEFPVLSEIM